MKNTARFVSLMALICAGTANAALMTQQGDINFSAGPVSGSGTLQVADYGDFVVTVQPFDTSLGVLDSFKVDWALDFSASGVVGTADISGSLAGSAGGTLYFGAASYASDGGGGREGGVSDDSLSIAFSVSDVTTFLPANAGVTYSPSILSDVLGASAFDLRLSSGYSLTYSNIDDLAGSVTGRAILTYDYTAAAPAVPLPATVALFAVGLLTMRRRWV